MVARIITSVVLFLSILFMPFWLSAIIALGAILYFHIYAEVVVLLFISDMLYGVGENKLFGTYLASTITGAAVLLGIEILKKKLKFYSK